MNPAPIAPAALADVIAPFGRSRMLPREAYLDPDVFAWEQRELFDGGWVCVGRAPTEPGGQASVQVGSTNALLARGGDGVLRAFANICRHRGHELLACGAQTVRGVIQCPYHAWSYELDGSLKIAPRFEAENFRPEEMGLVPLHAGEWAGFAFVNVSGTAGPLAEHVGDLAEHLAPWGIERLVPRVSHHYELAANWKLAQENYHECYHCPLIHPELCQVTDYRSGDNWAPEQGAYIGGTMELADHAATMSLDGSSRGVVIDTLDERQRRQVIYVGLFPNLLVSAHPDYVMTHRIEPIAPDASRIECTWLFPSEFDGDPSYASDFWDITNRQDWAAVESVQRGVASPSYIPGVLAPSEDAVYQFVTLVARAYLGGPVTAATGAPKYVRP